MKQNQPIATIDKTDDPVLRNTDKDAILVPQSIKRPQLTTTTIASEEESRPSSTTMDWINQLAHTDPDYEIDSDGHYVPRSPDNQWSDEQLAAADAAYQKTTQGLEPCEKCESRKTFCYRCDQRRCHTCAQGTCPDCAQTSAI